MVLSVRCQSRSLPNYDAGSVGWKPNLLSSWVGRSVHTFQMAAKKWGCTLDAAIHVRAFRYNGTMAVFAKLMVRDKDERILGHNARSWMGLQRCKT